MFLYKNSIYVKIFNISITVLTETPLQQPL
jgi:hypothetical protein